MKYSDLQNLLRTEFPQSEHEADAGYILRDGTIIDISNTDGTYCHGKEFYAVPSLRDWRSQHSELPSSHRLMIDTITQEIGAIQFTIDNCHLQCIRLPKNSLTVKQKTKLTDIVNKCLGRGFIRISILGTNEGITRACAESPYLMDETISIDESLTAETIMGLIEGYYAEGHF